MKGRGESYEILYDLPAGEYSDAGVGAIRTRTVRAGALLVVEAYPLAVLNREARRELRRRKTRAAMEAVNRRNTQRRVLWLLENNFTPLSYRLDLTFDYGFVDRGQSNMGDVKASMERLGVPMCDEDARKLVRNFFDRVRYWMKKAGQKPGLLKYLYVIETTREPRDEDPNPLPPRYHFHIVIDAPGLDGEALKALWPYGYGRADHLDFRFGGMEPLAKYLTKQRGAAGYSRTGDRIQRRWAHSRNLKNPDIRVSDRKISRRRARRIAEDVRQFGREILERLYPGYRCAEEPVVKYSDFVSGAYIYSRLRKIE